MPIADRSRIGHANRATRQLLFFYLRRFFPNPQPPIPHGNSRHALALGMERVVAVHLPRPLIEKVDAVTVDESRFRANLIRVLVTDGLQRREAAGTVDQREG
jgi:hypothetical protein